MNKHFFIFVILVLFGFGSSAQEAITIYKPGADAKAEVTAAIAKANTNGKHVFLQIGGNWCPWCVKFHKFITEDSKLDSLVQSNYEVVKINYSKEDDNRELLASFGFPQRFGFPVFVILDNKGKVLHTQDSWYLEQDKTYNREKVEQLFRMWSAKTLKEASEKFGEK
jgi:thioredoxin-related protein